MITKRRIGAVRPMTIASVLLLSTALAAPAFAEVEEVVVTAQKKSEDIQTVPIAVTAYTAQDLAAHQITKFSDLQFATPNVTYSQANFGGANFQVRGIGITAVGAGAESGVAINFADVFLAAPPTDGATFYDLQDLEVLRGPQSTLYGRGATGGVVNIAPNRPDLSAFGVQADATYGNYNAMEVKGAVNIPIVTDQLGIRISGDWIKHNGFTENVADGSHQQDRDTYSVRGAVRWEPDDKTTVDFLIQTAKENDARGRADKELCAPDPTGVLGCTPGAPVPGGALNLNATYLNILASKQGFEGLLGGALSLQGAQLGLAGLAATAPFSTPGAAQDALTAESNAFFGAALYGGANIPDLLASLPPGDPITDPVHYAITNTIQGYFAGGYTKGVGLGYLLGLTDTSAPFTPPANSNPTNYRQVNDDFNPINRQQDNFMSLEVKRNINSWLDADLVAGTDHSSYFNQQSYTNTFGTALASALSAGACAPFIAGATNTLSCAEAAFLGGVVGPSPGLGTSSLQSIYSQFFSHPGELPVSNFTGLGISSGSINHYSSNLSSYDEASGSASQYSGELRFNSKFEGPVNFMLGGYYLSQDASTNYYVASNSLDYASILDGGLGTLIDAADPLKGPLCYGVGTGPGCLEGPSYYHNEGRHIDLVSKALFGEVYYDIVPDLLKLTLGGRFTVDEKSQQDRIAVLSGLIPIGASNEDQVLASEAQSCIITDSSYLPPVCGFDPNTPASSTTGQPFIYSSVEYKKWTGRAVLDYTPTLDFTDKTLFYASYARGYKAGGFNPGVQGGIAGLPLSYNPEFIDAYEVGTKNIALDGHLQANGDLWYYNYTGLQVSAIIDNTSINENISAKLWGAEGEVVWQATDALQFNVNLSATHSGVTRTSEVDERNPTGGDPRAILIKDNSLTSSANQNCVIYDLNSGPVTLPQGYTFVPSAVGPQLATYEAPPGGQTALAGSGIPNVAFGSCSTSPQLQAFLTAQGYSETDPSVPGSTYTGVPVSLNGNQMQQTPDMTVSVGAQYTFITDGDYTVVPRVDYYWQSHMWGRIFHDKADYIKAWDVMNAQITLNAPDDSWYVGAYVKNVFNKTYVTGEYLTSSSSGLYTNAFLGDPRMYGVQAGVKF